jgi:hypothetical protein
MVRAQDGVEGSGFRAQVKRKRHDICGYRFLTPDPGWETH